MNSNFTEFGQYQALQYMGSGDGITSLKHKLDCRIAASDAMLSHLPGVNIVEKLIAQRFTQVLALVYIPFGKRGKKYVEAILKTKNKTFEESAYEHIMYVVRGEHISEYDQEYIDLGTQKFQLDFNDLPILTYKNLPHIMFILHEMLDELNRSGLWPDDPCLSNRDYIFNYMRYHMEKDRQLVLPEKILDIFASQEFIEFTNSPLSVSEQNYLDNYLMKINFFNIQV